MILMKWKFLKKSKQISDDFSLDEKFGIAEMRWERID